MTRSPAHVFRRARRQLLAAALTTVLALPIMGSAAFGAPPETSGLVSPTGTVERVIVLRPNRVDLVSGSRAWSVPRGAGEISLPGLAALLPDEFLRAEGNGVFRLRAGLVQTPDTRLRVAAPEVLTLLLESGEGADGASLQGSGAQLTLRAITVQAVQPGASTGAPPEPTRGFLAYRGSSRLVVTDTQLNHLGASSPEKLSTGLVVSSGSSLSVSRSGVSSAIQGITVNASELQAEDVAVRGARDDGIELQSGSKATLSDVTVESSGRTGIMLRRTATLTQPGPLRLLENRHWGLRASGQAGLKLTGVTAARNGVRGSVDGGGVRLSQCSGCIVADVTVHANHGTGLSASGSMVQVRNIVARLNDADGVELAGCVQCGVTGMTGSINGISGLLIHNSRDVTVATVTATDNPRAGIALGDCIACSLRDLRVRGGNVGVRVSGRSGPVDIGPGSISGNLTGVDTDELTDRVSLSGLTITGATKKGVQLAGHTASVTAITIDQRGGTALSSAVPGLRVSDSRFLGADRGLDLDASATVTRSTVYVTRQGVTVDGPSQVDLTTADIAATGDGAIGVRTSPGATTSIAQTRILADNALQGDTDRGLGNDIPFAPNWLGIFMVSVVCAAFGLELMRRAREPVRDQTVPAPDHVSNIS